MCLVFFTQKSLVINLKVLRKKAFTNVLNYLSFSGFTVHVLLIARKNSKGMFISFIILHVREYRHPHLNYNNIIRITLKSNSTPTNLII